MNKYLKQVSTKDLVDELGSREGVKKNSCRTL